MLRTTQEALKYQTYVPIQLQVMLSAQVLLELGKSSVGMFSRHNISC